MSKKIPIIVITGASGFLGSTLVKYFSEKGWKVRALVRNIPADIQSENVTYIEYSLENPINNEATIFKDADYLVHTAYVKFNRDNPYAYDINVKGAKNLINASKKYGLKSLFVSTMSAHSEAESVYGKQKLAIEELLNTNYRDVVLRSGLIIGNGGIVREMGDFMKSKHIAPLIVGGKQPLQIIAIADLVRVIERALTMDKPGIYTVATPEVYSYKSFYQALSEQLGVRVLFIPIPFWVLILALRTASFFHLHIGISEDNALGLKKLKTFNTAPDLQRLGIKISSLPEALRQLKTD